MLQKIREKATGIIGIVIIVLISITFALWGVQNYFMGNVATAVATVNDVEIDVQEFEQRYAQYRQRLAAQGVDTSVLDEPIRRREFLEAMIDSEVWRQAAIGSGITITPNAVRSRIRGIQAFNVDGEFNPDVYVELLSIQGLTPQMLEADVRESALVERIPDVLSSTAWAPETEIDRLVALANQRRSFDYLTFSADSYVDGIEIDDEAIAAYYEEHRSEFREPEKVTIEYVEIDAANYADEILVDDLVLQEIYEQEKNRFRTPERRLASHILIEVSGDADEATVEAARARAAELAAQARDGGDFAELAREHSDDFVSGEEGGDLGWVSSGDMVEPFEVALFDMEQGAISDPVRTSFGFHVIFAREIDEERGQRFEEARDQLASEYREAEAERQFIGLQDQLEELLNYSDVPDMEMAAGEMGLDVGVAGPFPRTGGEGIAARPEVIEAAFSETVLDEGLVSDPVLIETNHVVFVRVTDHAEARTQELDEVRDQVADAARRDAARNAALAAAEAVRARAAGGETLEAIAAEDESLTVETAEEASRFGGQTPPALLRKVFELPRPDGDTPSHHVLELAGDQVAVVAFRGISTPDEDTMGATAQFMAMRASRSFSAAELSALGRELRERAEVQINSSLVSGIQQ